MQNAQLRFSNCFGAILRDQLDVFVARITVALVHAENYTCIPMPAPREFLKSEIELSKTLTSIPSQQLSFAAGQTRDQSEREKWSWHLSGQFKQLSVYRYSDFWGGSNGIRTHDLYNAATMLYWATKRKRRRSICWTHVFPWKDVMKKMYICKVRATDKIKREEWFPWHLHPYWNHRDELTVADGLIS